MSGRRERDGGPRRPSDRPSSRLGGAIMLGLGALAVIAIVVVLIAVLGNGSSSKHSSTPVASGTTKPATPSGTTSTSGTNTSQAQVVAQNNLNPPNGSGPAKGVGIVVKEGSAYGIVIEAAHVPPNSHNAYAVWLFNSPTDAYRVGFVNPAVGKRGTLQVGSALPTNAGRYKQLLLTVETASNPKTPGPVILQGQFKGVPATS